MFANALRFSRPQLQTPVILYSIFASVSGTYAPIFATMAQSVAFVEQLLKAFLTGFGIATGVHLLVFPRSSRDVVQEEFASYLAALKRVFKAQQKYLWSMEHGDMLEHSVSGKGEAQSDIEKASKDLKAAIRALAGLHAKVHADLPFAQREIAFGHLHAKDYKRLFSLLRSIFLPTLGIGSIVDIFERIADAKGWNKKIDQSSGTETSHDNDHAARQEEISEWNEIMQTLHQPFESVTNAMTDGIDHAIYGLHFAKQPKETGAKGREEDVESKAGVCRPGDPKFSEHLCALDKQFWDNRADALRIWCVQKGVKFPEGSDLEGALCETDMRLMKVTSRETSRQQLYLILYMEYLLHSTSQGVLDLVKFVDEKVVDGTMSRNKLLAPGKKRLKKWFRSAMSNEDGSTEHEPDSAESQIYSVTLGDAFHKQKDPEHMPPTNAWERFGNSIRKVSRTFKSTEFSFGFRVACATMSIAIIAFLQSTQNFFVTQRLVWAMIMVNYQGPIEVRNYSP